MIDIQAITNAAPVQYRKSLLQLLYRFAHEEHDEFSVTIMDTSDPDHVPLSSINAHYLTYNKSLVKRITPNNPRQLIGCWIQVKTKGRDYPYVLMSDPTAPGVHRGVIRYDRGRVSSEFNLPDFEDTFYGLYTGIGSRNLRGCEYQQLFALGSTLAQNRLLPRSGHAVGSDYVIELGARTVWPYDQVGPEIYLPHNGFNQGDIEEDPWLIDATKLPLYVEAERLIRDVHPYGQHLKGFALAAHIRNAFQVLGSDLKSPSLFLLCCADPAKKGSVDVKGGTGTAVKLAQMHGVEIYNLRTRPYEEIYEILSITRP